MKNCFNNNKRRLVGVFGQIGIGIILIFSISHTAISRELSVSAKSYNGYHLVSGSQFSRVLILSKQILKTHKKLFFTPLSLEHLQIMSTGKRQIDGSWSFDKKGDDLLANIMANETGRVFAKGDAFQSADKPDNDTFVVATQLTKFTPSSRYTLNSPDYGPDAGKLRELGEIEVRFIIMEPSNHKIVALLVGRSKVATGHIFDDTRFGHNRAWQATFKQSLKVLQKTMTALVKS